MSKEISLCMIVRNEEQNLLRCLNSIKDLVDEFIILDTGSTDNTIEIALDFGCKVYHFEWTDDFSAARNESLKYPTKDYILIMDADDELDPEDVDKFKLLKDSLDDTQTIYSFQTVSHLSKISNSYMNSTTNLMPRLFPNNSMYYYINPIHEQLKSFVSPSLLQKKSSDIHIFHYGYLDDSNITKEKFNRNISILQKQIENNPNELFHYFNIGSEYCSIYDFEEALKYFLICYNKFNPSLGYSSKLIFKMAICYYSLNKQSEFFSLIENALSIYPNFSDLYYLRGMIYFENHSYSYAIDDFSTCINLGPSPAHLLYVKDASPLKSYDMISRCYEKLENYFKAFEFATKAISVNPKYILPLYNCAKILKLDGLSEDEIETIILPFVDNIEKNSYILADVFYMSKLHNISLKYIRMYENKYSLSEDLIIFKIKLLLRVKEIDDAILCCDTNIYNDINFFNASKLKSIAYLLKSNTALALKTINHFSISSATMYQQKVIKVITATANLLSGQNATILCESKDNVYTDIIFEILEIFLCNQEFDKFEILLNLLNLIDDNSVLLRLANLYYDYGYKDMAKKEIFNSIKHFDLITKDSVEMLQKCLLS